ncbi:MAG: hypothetical protein CL607_13955 [Anaerolineaceae bacterium]|nr:hypothetical protein [Anaerolineaceae bacterium]
MTTPEIDSPIICVGAPFIDDIIFPDGRSEMCVLGGGSIHAAAGMRIFDAPGVPFGYMGNDMPERPYQALANALDLSGMIRLNQPHIRAWQLFEWDGRRTELYRVDDPVTYQMGPPIDAIPASLRHTQHVYLLTVGRVFAEWRAAFPEAMLFWEPHQPYMQAANAPEFRRLLKQVDVVSPNLLEAQSLYGLETANELVDAMLEDGAPVVVLRMGEHGSIAATPDKRVTLPAYPIEPVVDVTGAGNTYCGAFFAMWSQHRDLELAACAGATAASFAIEQIGVALIPLDEDVIAERDQRLAWMQAHAEITHA